MIVTLSGHFQSSHGYVLYADEQGRLALTSVKQADSSCRLRAKQDFWLSKDDGNVGKEGNPQDVFAKINGKTSYVWVEPRGRSGNDEYEFGLVLCRNQSEYGNRFLAVSPAGVLMEKAEWPVEQNKKDPDVIFRVMAVLTAEQRPATVTTV